MAPTTDDPGSTLPALYLRHIADQVRGQGADVRRWLAESGLSESQLGDPALAVPLETFVRLVQNSIAATAEPALGLLVGERLLATSHGILGYAAMNSGTIRQALDLLERYARLRLSLLSISHQVVGDEMRVRFRTTQPLGDVEPPVLEAVVLSTKNILDAISMGACQVGRVCFPFAEPPHAALARDLFHADVAYAQGFAGFTITVDGLDLPLKLADPLAFRDATLICQRELDKLTKSDSLSARVRRLLLEKQSGFPSLQVTARLFYMTPRTLHRRLIEEGTSYRMLLEEVRHTLAIEHMKSGRFTLEEIAYTLGYSDLANFRRAFKRWESVPPSAYRKRTGKH